MFYKSKQLLIGFILGALVFTVVPIYAEVKEYVLQLADYKLLVDGTEYNDTEQPLLNYQGSTYIPLRKVSDILGVQLNWNAKLNQAEIVKTSVQNSNSSNNKPKQTIPIPYEKDGVMLVDIDGIEHIEIVEINKFCTSEYPFQIDYDTSSNTLIITHYNKDKKEQPVVIYKESFDNIPNKHISNRFYIEYEYFKNTILQLLKKQEN
ncbi:MAG TPA: stalk domain-containing protein [Patescibacteria group bacterium]|nr:stalk domain-containing protein [Patescibacteria group bacterium]